MFEPSRAGEFWAVPRNSCPDVRPNGMFGLDVDVRDGPLIIGGRRLTCLVTCFLSLDVREGPLNVGGDCCSIQTLAERSQY